jgi:geranylgeranylglycerol-phosphate geranylgeranyltransferase
MNSERINGFVRIIRPFNVAFTFVTIGAVCLVAGGHIDQWGMITIASVIGALMTAGANAINDAFDRDIDRVNRPDRPIPRGVVTPREAIWVWGISTGIAIALGLFLPPVPRIIVLAAGVVLFVYSSALKRTILAGNVVVALMIALAFIFAGTVVEHPAWAIVPALFAFLTTFAREMIKDVEDVNGDRAEGAATLPVRYGIKPSLALITVDLLALVAVTAVAAALRVYTPWFLLPIAIVDVAFIYTAFAVWKDTSPAVMRRHSARMKMCMVGGLIAIIIGSL